MSTSPRSKNGGYQAGSSGTSSEKPLQCVHGSRTVVMTSTPWTMIPTLHLQWVHGPRTVVMRRSRAGPSCGSCINGSTVREPWLCPCLPRRYCYSPNASMGPLCEVVKKSAQKSLTTTHRPRILCWLDELQSVTRGDDGYQGRRSIGFGLLQPPFPAQSTAATKYSGAPVSGPGSSAWREQSWAKCRQKRFYSAC